MHPSEIRHSLRNFVTMTTTPRPPLVDMESYPVRYVINSLNGRYIEAALDQGMNEVVLYGGGLYSSYFNLLGKTTIQGTGDLIYLYV